MKRLRLLLADDHVTPLERVVGLPEKDYDIVAYVDDGNALVKVALKFRAHLGIADISSMPGLSGNEAVRKLKGAGSSARFIFLTVYEDLGLVADCLEAGWLAYVAKACLASSLIPAITVVLTNRKYVSPAVSWERPRKPSATIGQPSRL